MESCIDKKCLCESHCGFFGSCAIKNELFLKHTQSVIIEIKRTPKENREARIIELLQAFQPPKVSGAQMARYFGLKKKQGIDLDRGVIPKSERAFHARYKRGETDKKRKKVFHLLKTDDTRRKRKANKERTAIVRKYLDDNNINVRTLNEEQKIIAYRRAANFADWYASEPQCNFHE